MTHNKLGVTPDQSPTQYRTPDVGGSQTETPEVTHNNTGVTRDKDENMTEQDSLENQKILRLTHPPGDDSSTHRLTTQRPTQSERLTHSAEIDTLTNNVEKS